MLPLWNALKRVFDTWLFDSLATAVARSEVNLCVGLCRMCCDVDVWTEWLNSIQQCRVYSGAFLCASKNILRKIEYWLYIIQAWTNQNTSPMQIIRQCESIISHKSSCRCIVGAANKPRCVAELNFHPFHWNVKVAAQAFAQPLFKVKLSNS